MSAPAPHKTSDLFSGCSPPKDPHFQSRYRTRGFPNHGSFSFCTRSGPSMAPLRLPTSGRKQAGPPARQPLVTHACRPPVGSKPGLQPGSHTSRTCRPPGFPLFAHEGLSVPQEPALAASGARMAERRRHRVSEAQDGRSERPAMGHGQPRATQADATSSHQSRIPLGSRFGLPEVPPSAVLSAFASGFSPQLGSQPPSLPSPPHLAKIVQLADSRGWSRSLSHSLRGAPCCVTASLPSAAVCPSSPVTSPGRSPPHRSQRTLLPRPLPPPTQLVDTNVAMNSFGGS